MATKDQHRKKAEHNERLVAGLQDPFWDWKVCVMFYAAIHYVHSYFEAKKVTLPPSMDHKKRLRLVQWHLRHVYKAYEDLYNDSRDARYEADITFTEKETQELQKRLDSIKKAVIPHL